MICCQKLPRDFHHIVSVVRQSDKLGRKQDQVWVVRKIYATDQTRYPTV